MREDTAQEAIWLEKKGEEEAPLAEAKSAVKMDGVFESSLLVGNQVFISRRELGCDGQIVILDYEHGDFKDEVKEVGLVWEYE